MEDSLKLQKLAAGRKKLKSYQQKKNTKKQDENPAQASEDPSSSTNYALPTQSMQSEAPQLQSYFAQPINSASFFDVVTAPAEVETQVPLEPLLTNNVPNNQYLLSQYEQQNENDCPTYEDPELNVNIVQDLVNIENTDENLLEDNERLRQFSDEVKEGIQSNGYTEDNNGDSNFSDLEKRSLELVDLYEKEKLQSELLAQQLEHYKAHVQQLESQLSSSQVECDNKIRSELEHEIQTHRQTIGILVAEKTELMSELGQSQMLNKQKSAECDELSGRLKTSRSRVADIEKELQLLKEERNKYQKDLCSNSEIQKVQEELSKITLAKSDIEQDLEETRQRLKKSQEELQIARNQFIEGEKKLEMANLKMQQLTKNGDAVENVVQEKLALEQRIADLNALYKTAITERDQASNQYQQYVQQLNANVSSLAQKLEASVIENENMSRREQDLIRHMGDMEKHLQNLQQENTTNNIARTTSTSSSANISQQNEEFLKELEGLKLTNASLEEKLQQVIGERDQFIEELAVKKDAIEDLESLVERIKSNESNSGQLLAAIESEKVAASRAVEQNITLKQQLEEMQGAFIKMTIDKAELLHQLSSAEFQQKEKDDALETLNHQMQTLKSAIEIKDRELTQMRERDQYSHEEHHQHHYEEHDHHEKHNHHEEHDNHACDHTHDEGSDEMKHLLEEKLYQATEEIRVLKMSNKQLLDQLQEHLVSSLRPEHNQPRPEFNQPVPEHNQLLPEHYQSLPEHYEPRPEHIKPHPDPISAHPENPSIPHPEHPILHAEHPIPHPEHPIPHPEHSNQAQVHTEPPQHQKTNETNAVYTRSRKNITENDLDSRGMLNPSKELAMQQLERKFMQTMQQFANLQDEKQFLEHLVTQLQGETETIGEYIALYQHQRGVLKQRAMEKEAQLSELAKDREQMKQQLNLLNNLVHKLVAQENSHISDEQIKEHRQLAQQTEALCDEHAKLHRDMKESKGTGDTRHETARQIVDLLGEIKSSNLVQPSESGQLHPCPWCSGKLMTV